MIKVGMIIPIRNDMLEHRRYLKQEGIELDVLIPQSFPQHKKDTITNSNLNCVTYHNTDDLMNKMKQYDIQSAYEMYGEIQLKFMESYDMFLPEMSWNRPTYGTYWYIDNKNINYDACLSLAKSKVKLFVARSKSVADSLVQEGIDTRKIKLVAGAVDIQRFKPRPKPEEYKDKTVFLFIGRVRDQKGIFCIFHSFVRANIKNSVLVYIGPPHPNNPWELDVLQKWVKKLNLEDRVIIKPGDIPQQEIHTHFNSGDVFITLPNTDLKFMEQIGFTVPQAMASGLPVITYDYAGQSEFVDDTCGVKIPHKDYVAGAKAMVALSDKDKRKEMSVSARAKAVEKYSAEVFTKKIKGVYEEMLR